jgi:hypothetical protein
MPHLEWAAAEGRVLLTHGKKTIPGHVYDRVGRGLPTPDVIERLPPFTVPQAVTDILIVVTSKSPADMTDQIVYLPL